MRSVLAQPKASVMGCEPSMRFSSSSVALETNRRYCSTKRALSVLPAPDSPLITTAWFCLALIMLRWAAEAMAKMCGFSWSSAMLALYFSTSACV